MDIHYTDLSNVKKQPVMVFRAVSTDILHFLARVLAVYGQGMFMGNL
jgi:threonyl-tRNA synthetase